MHKSWEAIEECISIFILKYLYQITKITDDDAQVSNQTDFSDSRISLICVNMTNKFILL